MIEIKLDFSKCKNNNDVRKVFQELDDKVRMLKNIHLPLKIKKEIQQG
ncbi:MAG: hypothetical protein IH845_05670 [Nanoarchaeota archaeon]|nr:hypothetical protein [Nanoarchaeota archaeon]